MDNTNTQNTFFGTKVSKPGINVNNASDKQLVYKDNFSTKVYYDNTNSRIVEGLLPDGTYGMWVSKPGKDVDNADAATNDNLVFNSNQDIFRIIASGSYTVTAADSSSVVTIPHNLGYAPVLQAYYVSDSVPGGIFQGTFVTQFPVAPSSLNNILMNIFVDDKNIVFLVPTLDTTTDVPFDVRYYLLQESIPLTIGG